MTGEEHFLTVLHRDQKGKGLEGVAQDRFSLVLLQQAPPWVTKLFHKHLKISLSTKHLSPWKRCCTILLESKGKSSRAEQEKGHLADPSHSETHHCQDERRV